MKLNIASDLTLPENVITQKLAFLGITGGGKTYAAGKLAELLLGIGAQVVILDPVGVFWGLRLAADGKGKGFDVPIFGGLKGDVPLEPTAGALIADLIVDRGISAVVDVSQFIPAESHKFAHAFAARLFQRRKAAPAPMHLILEECDDFVPQNLSDKGEEPKMLSAFTRLWKQGRNFGIGGSLLSQRPQEINKKVLNMSSTVFAFNMIGAQERDAVKAWLKSNMSGAERVTETLPSLEIGDAHVFSPRFLKFNQVVHILPKTTYDASATPDFKSARREEARSLTPIDLDEIKRAMAATIEKAKADDPQILRKRIAELEKELKGKPTQAGQATIDLAVKEAEEKIRSNYAELERKYQRLFRLVNDLWTQLNRVCKLATQIADYTPAPLDLKDLRLAETTPKRRPTAEPIVHGVPTPENIKEMQSAIYRTLPRPAPASNGHRSLSKGELTVLTAAAQYPDGATREQLTVLTGYKRSSRDTYLQRLRSAGLIAQAGDMIIATPDGVAALGPEFESLPVGEELQAYWLDRLPEGERRILEILLGQYPRAVDREALSEATDYRRSSRDTYLQRLSARRLITIVGRGEVRASEVFFE